MCQTVNSAHSIYILQEETSQSNLPVTCVLICGMLYFWMNHLSTSLPQDSQPTDSIGRTGFHVPSARSASYPSSNGPMLLSFIVDHPDPCSLEHALHLLWSSCGGKVHILRLLCRQQVPYSTSGNSQLVLVLLKHLWQDQTQMTLINIWRHKQSLRR